MSTEMLGRVLYRYADIAEVVGVSEVVLRNYRKRGYMPPPDVMLADRPCWYPETIEAWKADRDAGTNVRRIPA
ncbi:MAG: MarR family transcriptional regulator [Acidobacteria bacterium]|nr:MAG: MarR family transcriptional regulator [Acidobacteriota bacterium]